MTFFSLDPISSRSRGLEPKSKPVAVGQHRRHSRWALRLVGVWAIYVTLALGLLAYLAPPFWLDVCRVPS